jgi:hypothetical protein
VLRSTITRWWDLSGLAAGIAFHVILMTIFGQTRSFVRRDGYCGSPVSVHPKFRTAVVTWITGISVAFGAAFLPVGSWRISPIPAPCLVFCCGVAGGSG